MGEDERPKDVREWHGMHVSIEYLQGEERDERVVPADYGYFDGVPGLDGDSLDILMGPNDGAEYVYIAAQTDDEGQLGQFKVLADFADEKHALEAFMQMWPGRMGGIYDVPVEEFIEGLADFAGQDDERIEAGDLAREARRVRAYGPKDMWVDPQGVEHSLEGMTHPQWAVERAGVSAGADEESPAWELLQAGWIRVTWSDGVEVQTLDAMTATRVKRLLRRMAADRTSDGNLYIDAHDPPKHLSVSVLGGRIMGSDLAKLGEVEAQDRTAGSLTLRRKKSPGGRRDPNHKRMYKPIWWRKAGEAVAWEGPRGEASEGWEEVSLPEGAKVLQTTEAALRQAAGLPEGGIRVKASLSPDEQVLIETVKDQAAALASLGEVIKRLLGGGGEGSYDAVQTEDRLIVLNPQQLQQAPKRRSWA